MISYETMSSGQFTNINKTEFAADSGSLLRRLRFEYQHFGRVKKSQVLYKRFLREVDQLVSERKERIICIPKFLFENYTLNIRKHERENIKLYICHIKNTI